MEEAISILTEMYIREHIEGKHEILQMTKGELIKFCIDLLKFIQKQ